MVMLGETILELSGILLKIYFWNSQGEKRREREEGESGGRERRWREIYAPALHCTGVFRQMPLFVAVDLSCALGKADKKSTTALLLR